MSERSGVAATYASQKPAPRREAKELGYDKEGLVILERWKQEGRSTTDRDKALAKLDE